MIRQILKQIWNERRRNGWLLLELSIVSFFFLVMTDFLWIRIKNYSEPLGFDITHTFLLRLKQLDPRATAWVSPELIASTPSEDLQTLTERIARYPGVETVSVSFYAVPYPRGGWWDELRRDTTARGEIMQGRTVTPAYFEALRIRTPEGRSLSVEVGDVLRPVVVTEDVAEKLFGSSAAAVGQDVYGEDSSEARRIVAVCSRFKNQEFEPYRPGFFEVLTTGRMAEAVDRMGATSADLLVRVSPGGAEHFRESFETETGEGLRVNNLYVSSVVPSEELRDAVVGRALRGEIRQMGYVSLFVLATVCLGVFGTFWLRTSQRRGETGIRMATGASPGTIRRSMMAESLCLLLIAFPPALLVYLNLLSAEVLDVWRLPFDALRVGVSTVASVAVMSLIILGGVMRPAFRASSLCPAEALQYE
jgi:hypothetical protein